MVAPVGPVVTRRLRVLQSFRTPRPTSNPYLSLLLSGLRSRPELEVATFSWPRALLGSFDVLHVHWPEILLRGAGPARTTLRRVLFAALLLRLRARRTAVVRTVHNPVPHEGGDSVERFLLSRFDARTTVTVHLTTATYGTVAPGRPAVLVPHGHYRDHVVAEPGTAGRQPVPGLLLQFGLIRRYKNAQGLMTAFAALHDSDLRLRVVGSCPDAALAAELTASAAPDPRISLELRHLDDAALATELRAAELVVLPYRPTSGTVANSGAALLALSSDRPVLLPRGPATEELATEVGPGWVQVFDGELDQDDLRNALAAVRRPGRSARPDLDERDWTTAARDHLQAYRTAVSAR